MTRTRPIPVRRPLVAIVAAAFLALSLGACGNAGNAKSGSAAASTTTAPAGTTTPGAPAPGEVANYVSVGDSYAQGYQPAVDGVHPPFTDGYAYLLPSLARSKGYDLSLVNFGCGGATVESMSEKKGCGPDARSPGGPDYEGESQLQAAVDYLVKHRGQVELLTVSIGGNDVTTCASRAGGEAVQCVADAVARIEKKLGPLLEQLRAAAGPDVRIVGLTYPNVILGAYLQESSRQLAELSVTAFKQFINPMLKRSYESVGGTFVDVTEATDAYVPLTETTTLEPYGKIPVAVAEVCELTWFCERTDIHPRSAGYRRIAELIVDALPKR